MVDKVVTSKQEIVLRIPPDLYREFKQDVRIIIKWPGLIGIPVPDFLKSEALKNLKVPVYAFPEIEM
jgi:hypothetical protein